MKKLILSILFILCLSSQASAWNPMVVVSGSGGAALTCTASAVVCTTNDDYWPLGTSGNFQEIAAQGAEITICQIDLVAYQDGTLGSITVQVWNAAHDTQYGSDSTLVIDGAGDPGEKYEFTFGTNPVVPNAAFRVYMIEVDTDNSDIAVRASLSDACYGSDSYQIYTGDSPHASDAVFDIHTMQ